MYYCGKLEELTNNSNWSEASIGSNDKYFVKTAVSMCSASENLALCNEQKWEVLFCSLLQIIMIMYFLNCVFSAELT